MATRAEQNLQALNERSRSLAKANKAIQTQPNVGTNLLDPSNVSLPAAQAQGYMPTENNRPLVNKRQMFSLPSTSSTPSTSFTPSTSSTPSTSFTPSTSSTPYVDTTPIKDYTKLSGADLTFDEIKGITDSYTRQKRLAEYYKSKGYNVDTDAFDPNVESELDRLLKSQEQETTTLQKELARQKEEATRQFSMGSKAVEEGFAQSREGVVSEARSQLPGYTQGSMKSNLDAQLSNIFNRESRLGEMKAQQQREWVAGMDDQIQSEEKAIADSKANLQKLQNEAYTQQTSLLAQLREDGALANLSEQDLGVLSNQLNMLPPAVLTVLSNAATRSQLTETQKTKTDNMTKAVGMFKDMVASGVQMSSASMINFANQTGLPLQTLMDFNEQAMQINQAKGIDNLTKVAELQKLGYELDRQAKGITNAELEKVAYLEDLYKKGASQEEIVRAKKIMGIKDEDDPMYQAELNIKRVESDIKEAEANGKPPKGSAAYYDLEIKNATLKKIQAEYNEKYGGQDNADITTIGGFINASATSHYDTKVGYGIPGQRIGKHDGYDFVLPGQKNAQVGAPFGGKIISIEYDAGTGKGWGNSVVWMDNQGREHRISHLSNIDPSLTVGGEIMAGQYLGNQGNTGFNIPAKGGIGVHVDYRIKEDGKYIDPEEVLRQGQTKKDEVPWDIKKATMNIANRLGVSGPLREALNDEVNEYIKKKDWQGVNDMLKGRAVSFVLSSTQEGKYIGYQNLNTLLQEADNKIAEAKKSNYYNNYYNATLQDIKKYIAEGKDPEFLRLFGFLQSAQKESRTATTGVNFTETENKILKNLYINDEDTLENVIIKVQNMKEANQIILNGLTRYAMGGIELVPPEQRGKNGEVIPQRKSINDIYVDISDNPHNYSLDDSEFDTYFQ